MHAPAVVLPTRAAGAAHTGFTARSVHLASEFMVLVEDEGVLEVQTRCTWRAARERTQGRRGAAQIGRTTSNAARAAQTQRASSHKARHQAITTRMSSTPSNVRTCTDHVPPSSSQTSGDVLAQAGVPATPEQHLFRRIYFDGKINCGAHTLHVLLPKLARTLTRLGWQLVFRMAHIVRSAIVVGKPAQRSVVGAVARALAPNAGAVASTDAGNCMAITRRWASGKPERPMSPHLTIYRFGLNAITSVGHRGTGMFMTGGAWAYSTAPPACCAHSLTSVCCRWCSLRLDFDLPAGLGP